MPKGFCLMFLAALTLAATPDLGAQVYRCQGDDGVVYSDLPCGESAEQIVIDVPEPATDPGVAQAQPGTAVSSPAVQPAGESAPAAAEGEDAVSRFLNVLREQRSQQIGEIDRSIASLRAQTSTREFEQLDEARRAEILAELDRLTASRASIQEEYSALIREAQSRLE